ncbi:hypothetical protein R5W24_001063 [Gemmata sp. JC717]|uniref:hypothetical protein n=1 Tax=Gemmata algarum TaxID=2975278 RepID=UPI0021BB771B|nr:hypothetical protein [Gemmata algarum]MDY3551983.1 hypothetical protein [Gemmata algarum]
MFDWLFGSGCPLDPAAKEWVENRLVWLRDEFGPDDLYSGAVVLPTPAFFPDPYDGSRRAARVLFARVCDYMGVDPELLRLEFFRPSPNALFLVNDTGEALPTGAAGWYAGDRIRINEDELADPMSLVGTLAHELAHQRLLGEDRIGYEVFDNELLTDLTVVFKGMGIFLANVPRHWDGNYTYWPGTELRKPEYMTGPMFGYALALLAWVRGEPSPAWARYVKSGVRGELRQGLRFLNKHGTDKLRPLRRRG